MSKSSWLMPGSLSGNGFIRLKKYDNATLLIDSNIAFSGSPSRGTLSLSKQSSLLNYSKDECGPGRFIFPVSKKNVTRTTKFEFNAQTVSGAWSGQIKLDSDDFETICLD